METHASAAAATGPDDDTRDVNARPRILSRSTIVYLARVPDHKLTLKFIFEEYGITKRQLLRAYVTGEIEESPEPTGTLIQWIDLTFPEDIRTAIIHEGQMQAIDGYNRLAEEIRSLNANILALIGQLQIVTKHK